MVGKAIIAILFTIQLHAQTTIEHYSNLMVVSNDVMTENTPVNVTGVVVKNETITLYYFNSKTEYYYQIGFIGQNLKCLDQFGNIVEIEVFDYKLIIKLNQNKWLELTKKIY